MAAPAGYGYTLDNHHDAAAVHHGALAQLLDPVTRQRILDLSGWARVHRCLEVGAGGGSVAGWLADEVGPDGQVVATDLKPDHLPAHPRLQAIAHDLTEPAPWPEPLDGPFDLVVARLVLAHLPGRQRILHQLAQRLAPGGVLLVQSWSPVPVPEAVLAAPSPPAADLYRLYQRSVNVVFESAGLDRSWARRAHLAMAAEGLADVETSVHGEYWTGGGPGLRLVGAVAAQLRPRLLAAGMTEPQLAELDRLTADPQLIVHGHLLYSTTGRDSTTGRGPG